MSALIRGLDKPAAVLIMGASSGIGLAMARQLAADARVALLVAVSRRASACSKLAELAKDLPDRFIVADADIASETQLLALQHAVRARTPALNLVVNTAGLLHDGCLRPEKAIAQLTLSGLQRSFAVNAFGPVLLAQALLPLLRHGEPALFASLSARVGSISDNRLGGWYGYRAAKAAQNQLMKTFAIEFARLNPRGAVVSLHPGTTDTPLSRPFQGNVDAQSLFSPERAAGQLLDVLSRCTAADSGRFLAWDGQEIAW